ncbi:MULTISPECIES: type II secretion system F family protein [Amycolatopsis]|uniref:Tight adherence protein B n=2 Tax=Amycolatopsis TaxID=1813 RepID=A0A1I4CCD7_9PSEU|nr:type II secretion system F family protein [Amycolatopsis sacchari]SFK77977.1 tight adherence protein B [Amycolatopsis sacchari]
MPDVMLVCVAAALLLWPAIRPPKARLAALTRVEPRRRSATLDRRWLVALAVVPVVALSGPVGGVGAALLVLAVHCHRKARKRFRAEVTTANSMAEALQALVAELRSGVSAVTAAERAARDAPAPVAPALRALAVSARFAVDLPRGAEPHDQVAQAWTLSRRHGLPLAELLDAVRRDVVAQARFMTRADANMAGPRASAVVLAILPVVGVLLGEAIGAHPLHVLVATPPGQVVLMLGSVLLLAGVVWSERLTRLGVAR